MCHLALGLLLLVWSIASLGVEREQDPFGPKLELLSIDVAFARGLNPGRRAGLYRFSAGVMLTSASDDARIMVDLGGGPPRAAWNEPRMELERTESNGFRFVSATVRPYLTPLLSFGSAQHKLNLRLRRHSLLFQYRQDFD